MKALGSIGRNRPERSRSAEITCAIWRPIWAASAFSPVNSVTAKGMGSTRPWVISTRNSAQACDEKSKTVKARKRAASFMTINPYSMLERNVRRYATYSNPRFLTSLSSYEYLARLIGPAILSDQRPKSNRATGRMSPVTMDKASTGGYSPHAAHFQPPRDRTDQTNYCVTR